MSDSANIAIADSTLYEEIVRRIVAAIDPDKVVVFGSRARGDHRRNSDIDILVIAESDEPRFVRSRPLYGALSDIMLPMDIVVYTPDEVREWSALPHAFITTALREGKVLYERQRLAGGRVGPQGAQR